MRLLIFLLAASALAARAEPPIEKLKLPAGFKAELYAYPVPGARSLALAPDGTLYVGSQGQGKVYAVLPDKTIKTVAAGLDTPNGVAWRGGKLYVAEISRILRLDDPLKGSKPVVVKDDLPRETHHGWKFIRFGPDGKLYVPIGAPCNVCEKKDARFASIARMDPDGKNFQVFARGVRNSVGFDWHPSTRELWFTDNGRDRMGDDAPPDELNRAAKPAHFGFPYCHGAALPDPGFGGRPCSEFQPPAMELGPHVAALGMRFYRGGIVIAEHGSWNRSKKIGYRLTMVRLEKGRAVSYEPFVEGWLDGGRVWGRPVDVQPMPDGSLLVSDDDAGAIYRITPPPDK